MIDDGRLVALFKNPKIDEITISLDKTTGEYTVKAISKISSDITFMATDSSTMLALEMLFEQIRYDPKQLTPNLYMQFMGDCSNRYGSDIVSYGIPPSYTELLEAGVEIVKHPTFVANGKQYLCKSYDFTYDKHICYNKFKWLYNINYGPEVVTISGVLHEDVLE